MSFYSFRCSISQVHLLWPSRSFLQAYTLPPPVYTFFFEDRLFFGPRYLFAIIFIRYHFSTPSTKPKGPNRVEVPSLITYIMLVMLARAGLAFSFFLKRFSLGLFSPNLFSTEYSLTCSLPAFWGYPSRVWNYVDPCLLTLRAFLSYFRGDPLL